MQTLGFELSGLLVVTPFASLFVNAGIVQSLGLLIVLSLTVMAWTALYNTAFDVMEARFLARVASARPRAWRVVHALGLEACAVVVTWPVIVALTGLGWAQALRVDLALVVIYAVWSYAYHWLYDRWRPVRVKQG